MSTNFMSSLIQSSENKSASVAGASASAKQPSAKVSANKVSKAAPSKLSKAAPSKLSKAPSKPAANSQALSKAGKSVLEAAEEAGIDPVLIGGIAVGGVVLVLGGLAGVAYCNKRRVRNDMAAGNYSEEQMKLIEKHIKSYNMFSPFGPPKFSEEFKQNTVPEGDATLQKCEGDALVPDAGKEVPATAPRCPADADAIKKACANKEYQCKQVTPKAVTQVVYKCTGENDKFTMVKDTTLKVEAVMGCDKVISKEKTWVNDEVLKFCKAKKENACMSTVEEVAEAAAAPAAAPASA